jgi:hypothetical protein
MDSPCSERREHSKVFVSREPDLYTRRRHAYLHQRQYGFAMAEYRLNGASGENAWAT